MPLLPVTKIADLGIAKILNFDDNGSTKYQTKAPGTPHFMPPEALVDKPQYDTSLDILLWWDYTLHYQWRMAQPNSSNQI